MKKESKLRSLQSRSCGWQDKSEVRKLHQEDPRPVKKWWWPQTVGMERKQKRPSGGRLDRVWWNGPDARSRGEEWSGKLGYTEHTCEAAQKALEESGRKRLAQPFLAHCSNLKQREGVQTWRGIQVPTPLNDEGKHQVQKHVINNFRQNKTELQSVDTLAMGVKHLLWKPLAICNHWVEFTLIWPWENLWAEHCRQKEWPVLS